MGTDPLILGARFGSSHSSFKPCAKGHLQSGPWRSAYAQETQGCRESMKSRRNGIGSALAGDDESSGETEWGSGGRVPGVPRSTYRMGLSTQSTRSTYRMGLSTQSTPQYLPDGVEYPEYPAVPTGLPEYPLRSLGASPNAERARGRCHEPRAELRFHLRRAPWSTLRVARCKAYMLRVTCFTYCMACA